MPRALSKLDFGFSEARATPIPSRDKALEPLLCVGIGGFSLKICKLAVDIPLPPTCPYFLVSGHC